jgi:type VI secretion system protein ImpH
MASTSRRTSAPLIEVLLKEPYRFDFFQAVRILERAGSEAAETTPCRQVVGLDHPPRNEVVRFHALPSHTFPPSDISSLTQGKPNAESEATPPHMVVAFMGMTGPNGALPHHYTQLVIDRVRRKDNALREYLDVFDHRLIALFYRAWRKYRFFVGFERSHSEAEAADDDLFTHCLYCLVGMGTGGLRSRQEILDETHLYYAGHFAHFPRSASALEAILQDYFQLPVTLQQFFGQWMYLSEDDQSRLSSGFTFEHFNNQLGENVVIGERVWGVENNFRVRLGPLGYASFRRFSPLGDQLVPLCQLIRAYAGCEFDFDIQPVLRAEEVPETQLAGDGRAPSCLGWNTWLHSGSYPRDADDAVFTCEGWPSR